VREEPIDREAGGKVDGQPVYDATASAEAQALRSRVAELERARDLLRLQRDLTVALNSKLTLADALDQILDTALSVEGIECGGIYLADEATEDLRLIAHKGLSPRFVEAVAYAPADSPHARLALAGRPIYAATSDVPIQHAACDAEGLRSIGILPVVYEGRVIGLLNVASRTDREISPGARDLLEAIAAQIGSAITRVRSREALQAAHEELERRVAERTAELQRANERLRREMAERRQAEDALRASEERYRTILDQMEQAVIFADAEHVVREINACACTLLGVSREEVIGCDVLALHSTAMHARITELLRSFREEGHRQAVTARRSFGGRELVFRVSPVCGSDGGYGGLIAVILDLTEQIRMQQQLAEAQKLETVGRLAGGIAHDFNNLMQTALGSASRLRSKFSPDHPNHSLLVRIEQAADTAGRLAHQLLMFAKGGKILPRVVDFADVVSRAVEICRPVIPAGVTFDCAIADDLGQVECDTARTEQAIVNLCRNAIDAMPDGGRLTIRADNVTLAAPLASSHPPLPAGEYVYVAVEDTGVGIAPEVRDRLFDPFVTTKPQGHGLGLAAAYGTVRAHGGAIGVDTQPERGSTFRIWLPRVRPTAE